MIKMTKFILVVVVLAIVVGSGNLWYQTFLVGRYYVSAPAHLTILGLILPLIVAAVALVLIKRILTFNPERFR